MKTTKLEKKLNLNKKTISTLRNKDMNEVIGGATKNNCETEELSICLFCYNTHEYFTCGC